MVPERDENKRQSTVEYRGLDFADFGDFQLRLSTTKIDKRRPYGETRYLSVGYLHERLCVLCWMLRNGQLRIISLRKANDREKQDHDAGSR